MAASMDRLRDRWDSISPREQRLILTLIVTFVAVILIFATMRIRDGLEVIEAKNKKTRLALLSLQAYRVHKANAGDSPESQIGDQQIKIETYLEGIASEVGITIPRFNPLPASTRDGFTETSTRIEIRNLTIQQLKDFLEKVESRSNQVAVKTLEVKRGFGDKSQLNVNMTVSAYAKETKDAAGQGSAGGGSDAKESKESKESGE